MRRLLILRHAKADPRDHGTARDRQRPLTKRGFADAALIGQHMAQQGTRIGQSIVSDALRTRQTFEAVCAAMGQTPAVRFEPGLYDDDWQDFLKLIHACPDDADTLLLVGHNPDIAQFARAFVTDGRGEQMRRLATALPTCALVVADIDRPHWSDAAFGDGRLGAFVTPADLGGGPD